NDLLDRLYEKTLDLWYLQMKHVVSLVGGTAIHYKAGFQKGDVFESIPKKEQLRAVEFLCQNAFIVPEWLWNPDFLRRIKFSTENNKLWEHQIKLLADIMAVKRMKRLEYMYGDPEGHQFPKILFNELQVGLFEELINPKNEISMPRKELQYAYISLLAKYLESENQIFINFQEWGRVPSQYSRSLYRLNLQNLRKLIKSSFKGIKNELDKQHLELCLKKIDNSLNGQF